MNKNTKTALIIGGVIAALLVAAPLAAGCVVGDTGHDYGMMGGYGGWWFMSILGIIFLGLIIWAVVALTKGQSGSQSPGADSALEMLKRRYARGEIDKEEYEQKKKDLS
jgi:putative membrane protein